MLGIGKNLPLSQLLLYSGVARVSVHTVPGALVHTIEKIAIAVLPEVLAA